ncbi:MAG: hypothetical protein R3E51_16150 [Rhizobiaceae bacterium]
MEMRSGATRSGDLVAARIDESGKIGVATIAAIIRWQSKNFFVRFSVTLITGETKLMLGTVAVRGVEIQSAPAASMACLDFVAEPRNPQKERRGRSGYSGSWFLPHWSPEADGSLYTRIAGRQEVAGNNSGHTPGWRAVSRKSGCYGRKQAYPHAPSHERPQLTASPPL